MLRQLLCVGMIVLLTGCGTETTTTTADPAPQNQASSNSDANENKPVSQQTSEVNPITQPTTNSQTTPDLSAYTPDEIQRLKAEAWGDQSSRNMKHILLAFHNYLSANGHFPPAVVMGPDGKPWHSWRVLILPYIEQGALYNQYRLTEPWNSEHNLKISNTVVLVYNDPVHEQPNSNYTHYAAAAGADTVLTTATFDGTEEGLTKALSYGVSLPEITDGTTNTIIAGTISPEEKIVWTEPRDINVDIEEVTSGIPGNFAAPHLITPQNRIGAAIMGNTDGSTRTVSSQTPSDDLKALFTKSGGEQIKSVK